MSFASHKFVDPRTIFFLGLLLVASGLVSPPVALLGGVAFGFAVEHPFRRESSSLARLLLKLSVIALGFGMNLHQVIHAGRSGLLYTAISITLAMLFGLVLGKADCGPPSARRRRCQGQLRPRSAGPRSNQR